jgi:hypothetical protein
LSKMNRYHTVWKERKRSVLIFILLIAGTRMLLAEEGMWIPLLIEKYQIGQMQQAGLKLAAEDIYSVNQACLSDAVIIFGRGCTGEMISDRGLVLTNHHCGEDVIQSHSSVEHNYLSDGFWAMGPGEEMPSPGLSVTFLRYMEDVTDRVMEGVVQGMDPDERIRKIEMNQGRLIRDATSGNRYDAEVKPFYYGNDYYLFVYERFTDVRWVGAPPVSIGNFGGDRDNWIWPRHTGDFSLFRIYADAENRPADYDPSNRPYRPRKHLEINMGGIQEGDFTMVLGTPARTIQYLYSGAVAAMMETSLPLKIDLRSARLEIMDRYMKNSDVVRIQYAFKHSRVSNAWKKWQGMIVGLDRVRAVEKKREFEDDFTGWVNGDGLRQMKYDRLMDDFALLYGQMDQYSVAIDLLEEGILEVEVFRQLEAVLGMMQVGLPKEELEFRMGEFFRDFYMPVDRDFYATVLKVYQERMPERLRPDFFLRIQRKYKGDISRFAEAIYSHTILADTGGPVKLLDQYNKDPGKAIQMVREDPMYLCLKQFKEIYDLEINPGYLSLKAQEEKLYKTYMAALMEMSEGRLPYPDANCTLRVSYGKVEGYQPRDGVDYLCSTTLDGVMEKYREGLAEYRVPEKLADLFRRRDFGKYGVDGTMPVCFIASNHTSGGNSGSPVLDSEGRLVGLNFDRGWEGTMSDLYYDPSLCRNIAVDIRYVLFIIDKFAGAGYLLNEMELIW